MGIDRPYEDDVPTVEHDSLAAGRDSPGPEPGSFAPEDHDTLTDSELDRATYTAELRARVGAAYEAAWVEAVPAFHAAWAQHTDKYPYPEQSRPSLEHDGSWQAKDNLGLEPDQNAEIDNCDKRNREVGENVVVPAVCSIAAEDTGRHLVGFEHRFKESDRLKEKVADQLRSTPGLTPAQALALIPDAVRFTLQYPYESYAAGVRKDIERFEGHGFIQEERRNTWTSDQYKGINSRWREPDSGLVFEVQFHTRVSFEAKELTHKAYERIRTGAEDPERAELKEFQRQVCARIPVPPGASEYEDYIRENHNG